MKRSLPDLSTYSEEDTKAIATLALTELSLSSRVKAVLEAFNDEECQELASWLNDKIEGKSENEDD